MPCLLLIYFYCLEKECKYNLVIFKINHCYLDVKNLVLTCSFLKPCVQPLEIFLKIKDTKCGKDKVLKDFKGSFQKAYKISK